jgi:aspartyl-tRNA(Asn)/glutamyl-tRNA(Gln) amidotransferase subunit A
MAVEAAAHHADRARRRPDDYPPRVRALLDEGLATPAPEYAACREHQRALRREMVRLFDGPLAAGLTPAATGPAPAAATTGDPGMNSPWSYVGLPTVSVPAGWSADGLPLAVQLVGGSGGLARVLAVAAMCEARVGFESKLPPVPRAMK